MSHCLITALSVCVLFCQFGLAGEPPANSKLVVDDSFERDNLSDDWHVNTGKWRIEEGVLKVSELPDDNHSAAARRVVETQNAVYEMRFRLVGDAQAFHFGFDPAKGELDKKGHLFSVIVTPESWKILKHVDKSRPEDDPNKVLASAKTNFVNNMWYTLRVTTWGNYVTARIDGMPELKAEHATFHVRKPTLVFRCVGDGVEIDDLKVWIPEK